VEVPIASYQAELVPAGMRASTVSSLQFSIIAGGLIATGINTAFSTGTTNAAWRIPVGMTFVSPTLVLMLLPFLPDAPRWLLFKGRREDAIKTLRMVRPTEDVDAGMCELEIEAIEEAMQENKVKLPWSTPFRGINARRTTISCLLFVCQQFTGQAFTSSYSTIFYRESFAGRC
jgi:SP family sugar:H+ symporter-like MFS transporter